MSQHRLLLDWTSSDDKRIVWQCPKCDRRIVQDRETAAVDIENRGDIFATHAGVIGVRVDIDHD